MSKIKLSNPEAIDELHISGLYVTRVPVPGIPSAEQEQAFIRLVVGKTTNGKFEFYGTRDLTLTDAQFAALEQVLSPIYTAILNRLVNQGMIDGTVES